MSPMPTPTSVRRLIARSAAACALLVCSLAGCASSEKDSDWVSAPVAAPSEQILWDVIVQALQRERYPVGAGLDPVTRTAVSGWRNDLAPFRGEGFRERATVQVVPLPAGQFETRVRVEVERNMDIVRPLDLQFAKWEPAPDDRETAELLLQTVRSQLAVGLGR